MHSRDPWLISLDNVLDCHGGKGDECQGIIEAVGGRRGEYIKPSTTAKPVRQPNGQVVLTDVPDQIRTSHNAWCQHRGRLEERASSEVDGPAELQEDHITSHHIKRATDEMPRRGSRGREQLTKWNGLNMFS